MSPPCTTLHSEKLTFFFRLLPLRRRDLALFHRLRVRRFIALFKPFAENSWLSFLQFLTFEGSTPAGTGLPIGTKAAHGCFITMLASQKKIHSVRTKESKAIVATRLASFTAEMYSLCSARPNASSSRIGDVDSVCVSLSCVSTSRRKTCLLRRPPRLVETDLSSSSRGISRGFWSLA